jgi:5-methylcytosine-specific restriction enzyme subunit McrC
MSPIRVFEYEKLWIGEKGFTDAHFRAIVKYNEKHKSKYFAVGYNSIKFLQYVGVIQVGNVTIEILPKADREENTDENRRKWHDVLIDLLKQCKLLKYESLSSASLSLKSNTILDLYVEVFLNEVDRLLHNGLVKKYRANSGNLNALKGNLQFSKQISKNLTHQERFYTTHQIYDVKHILNQILYEAMFILIRTTTNSHLKNRIAALTLNFPEISRITVTENTFSKIVISRKSEPYKYAIELARLIILNYTPDIKSGGHNILAILFDMNQLFEEYIYRQLKRIEDKKAITVSRQQSEYFWESKKIRPDIVITSGTDKYVIDTKWKVLKENKPSDDDLKQIYTYNLHFTSKHSLLIYPKVNDLENTKGKYNLKYRFGSEEEAHYCQMVFVEIFDKGIDKDKLKRTLGAEILSVFEGHNTDC